MSYLLPVLACFVLSSFEASAQFDTNRNNTFGQNNYSTKPDANAAHADTAQQVFSFKTLFRGLAHKQEMPIGYAFGASMIIPGLGQYYNRDYWKIPVIYAGMGTCIGLGVHNLNMYKKSISYPSMPQQHLTQLEYKHELASGGHNFTWRSEEAVAQSLAYKRKSTAYFIGAGIIYWASLLDVNVSYKINTDKSAGKATIYSILCPGAGQAYNGEYWKIPIYSTLTATGIYLWTFFDTQYHRFKRIHNEATNPDIPYTGPISAQTALWYRDSYRRNRDLSIVGTLLVYVLNIIDANVFSYMNDFDVTDDLAVRLEPTVISPINIDYASSSFNYGHDSALGLNIRFTF